MLFDPMIAYLSSSNLMWYKGLCVGAVGSFHFNNLYVLASSKDKASIISVVLVEDHFFFPFLQQPSRDAGFQMTKVVFFTPRKAPVAMAVGEARRRGYGIANTNSRLVLRSPKATLETYTQDVRGTCCTPAIFPPQAEHSGETMFSCVPSALMKWCQMAFVLFRKWVVLCDSVLVGFKVWKVHPDLSPLPLDKY